MVETDARTALAIIPARGGSRGVRGKNMRLLGGRPLIAWTLQAAREAGVFERIVVSTDDELIAGWADTAGAEVHRRSAANAGPQATIADAALEVCDALAWQGDVCVLQPTSPLRSAASIASAWQRYVEGDFESLMSVVKAEHLHWYRKSPEALPTPLFAARVNRQYLPHGVLQETGAIQFVRHGVLTDSRSMVGGRHDLFELPHEESLDIDTHDDLVVARERVARHQSVVVFRFTANATVGSGHLHHCLQLAQELDDLQVHFLLRDCDPFAYDVVRDRGYEATTETTLRDALAMWESSPGPKLLVNDILDTAIEDSLLPRLAEWRVVNIEDLGPGARHADLVINALYRPRELDGSHVKSGSRWATLRSDFLGLPPRVVRSRPERVLVTFGGTDPSGLANRMVPALDASLPHDVELRVVLGPAAPDLPPGLSARVTVARSIRSMAKEMRAADVVLTSAGRTVFEAAATGTPAVVVAANAREATHVHLGYESGVLFLGVGALLDEHVVAKTLNRLLHDHALRQELSDRLTAGFDTRGVQRISVCLRALLDGDGMVHEN